MCYYLHKCREASAFSSTSAIILGLMRVIVISGSATSACSLLTLITFHVWPNSLMFLGIDFVLPKIYINSLLAMLNWRKRHQTPTTRGGDSVVEVMVFAPRDSRSDVEESDSSTATPSVRSTDTKEDLIFHV
ncbi:hypothetical protein ARMGADRAFT_1017656 [Armillaria gallica]|uniref:DUF6534 domain-containing protein n=1 Tax=Armillaria gallica TaxID=47427 RepID=A0A2H3D9W7_ARMGA|nr:hypothetical protein ARMGADRAFT_1017656 [Armillaria gallica]